MKNFSEKYLDNFNQKCINSIFKWNNKKIHVEEFFDILIEKTKDLNLKKSKIFFYGNGASHAFAEHMSLDFLLIPSCIFIILFLLNRENRIYRKNQKVK